MEILYRKEHKLSGLVQAFKVLNTQEHRKARERVYACFTIYNSKEKKDTSIFVVGETKAHTETVRADFDQMGTLVREGTIQKDGFLEAYGETAYRCWNALYDHNKEERKRRHFNITRKILNGFQVKQSNTGRIKTLILVLLLHMKRK
jgi:hypothetical protein